MAFTTVAFSEGTSSATLDYVAAVADPHIRVSGDDIIVPELNKLVGYYAIGSSMTQARLSSPSLRAVVEPDIEPFDFDMEPVSNPNFHDRFDTPFELARSEAINFEVISVGTGASPIDRCIVWLGDGAKPAVPAGKMITVRATGTTTLTTSTWTNVNLTFSQTLPAGRYAVVGMRAASAGAIAARLVFSGTPWRPGVIGCDTDQDVMPDRFRYGKAGVWGEFEHNEPPTADFLSNSADTTETVHLDLIKIK